MFSPLPRAAWLPLLAVLLDQATAADFPTNAVSRLLAIAPHAPALAFARSNNIPLNGIDPFAATETLRPGDAITVLVTLAERGGRQSQWLLRHQVTRAPGPSNGVMVIHNTLGNQFAFPSFPTPITLRSSGPFQVDQRRPARILDGTEKVTLDQGYLGLGLDQAAAAVARLDPNRKGKGGFRSGTQPFGEAEIKACREFAADWKLTAAEERALGGAYPAMLSYFGIVQKTESLASILETIIARPSLFSLAVNLGIKSVEFNWRGARRSPLPAASWGLPAETPVYEIPMVLMLNKHPSLHLTMFVASPRPPLLACAGIIGILAEKPGKAEPWLAIRVVSARVAAPSQAE